MGVRLRSGRSFVIIVPNPSPKPHVLMAPGLKDVHRVRGCLGRPPGVVAAGDWGAHQRRCAPVGHPQVRAVTSTAFNVRTVVIPPPNYIPHSSNGWNRWKEL